jgi:dCTP deaminase
MEVEAPKEQIKKSAIDLSLSDKAFTMTKGSVKPPGSDSYSWFIEHERLARPLTPRKDGTFELLARSTYVFKLREKLHQGLAEGGIHGQATAKSSVGRVDVLARLIVDGMESYESFDPKGLQRLCGDMYLEITPITFNVKVREGDRLSQLRFFYGAPDDVQMKGEKLFRTILHGAGQKDGSLSVDLSNVEIGGLPVAAFYANPPRSRYEAIPLCEQRPKNKPDPCRYWRFKESQQKTERLKIKPGQFYILRSKERISVPPGIAIYCRASDETIGEMRIHYAGFVHPYFGWDRTGPEQGTPLTFEVRGHQVPVTLADGEKMANLIFYRMSEDSRDRDPGSYQTQTLNLSTFFGAWPKKLKKVHKNGTVEQA